MTNPGFPFIVSGENCIYKGIEYEHYDEFEDNCDSGCCDYCACIDGDVECEKKDSLCQKVEIVIKG